MPLDEKKGDIIMAEITFGIGTQSNIVGSGLGFYGATFGSSVQIGSFQDSTYVTNAAGTAQGPAATNIKFSTPGSGTPSTVGSGIPLTKINSGNRTFHVNFDHTSDVNVQNCQLRIYDRTDTNYPASGVVTKVAEILNFDGHQATALIMLLITVIVMVLGICFGGELLGQTRVHGELHKITTITLLALDSGTLPRLKQQLVMVMETLDLV